MNTFKLKNKVALLAVGSALSLLPATVMATNGYFSHGYGVSNKGQAGAGVAVTQNAMSGATNPAALAKAGNRFDFGIENFTPDRSAQTRDDNVTYDGNGDSSFLIPEFAYNQEINADMTFGVVVYGNGGMNTKYPSITQYSGSPTGSNTGMNMEQLFIVPTFTFKVNPKHSLGVSLNLIRQTFEATGLGGFCGFRGDGTCNPNTGVGVNSAAANAGLTDQGGDESTGYGIKVGWVGQLADNFSMGFAYQTESDMQKFDKYNKLFAEQGGFNIPSNWTLGVAFQPASGWNLMFDIQQINYTDVASISNPNDSANLGGTGTGQGFLGSDNGLGFGWEDMTVYKLGGEYTVNSNLVLRAGYSKTDQPIGANDTSFNLIAPAVIEEHFTFGMSYTLANKSEISAFAMYAPEVTVYGNTNTQGSSGNANLTMSQTAFGVGYGWNF